MKAILISIKPKWVAKILNKEKTIEVRKSKPKCELPIDVYIYCTKQNARYYIENKIYNSMMNGKVVAKFTLNKVVPIVMQMGATSGYGNNGYIGYGHCEKGNFKFMFDMEKETCVEHNEELCKYLNNGKNFDDIYINKLKAKNGYAWHISNLEVFDKPRELGEFKHNEEHKSCLECPYYNVCEQTDYIEVRNGICYIPVSLTKSPQSWQFIEVKE